jgi:hypothetical protein
MPGDNLKQGPKSHGATSGRTLEQMGISKTQSSRWQELAEIPKEIFEKHLDDPGRMPSTSGILSGMRAVNGATKMDDDSLWVWGTLRDFEKNRLLVRDASDVFGGMTDTMQEDVRRIVPLMKMVARTGPR